MTVDLFWFCLGLGLMLLSEVPSYLSRRASSVYGKFTFRCYDGALTIAAMTLMSYAFDPWWAGVAIVVGGGSWIAFVVKHSLSKEEQAELERR